MIFSSSRKNLINFVFFILLQLGYLELAPGISWYRCSSQNLGPYVFSFLTSSSQFVSSTDGCAWLESDIQKKRDVFFDTNFENIKEDASRGDGETMGTFLNLYSCNPSDSKKAKELIKNEYDKLFGVDPAHPDRHPKIVNPARARAERGIFLIIKNSMIGSSCKI